jgi:peptidoglycan hydrolase CwlO-like protein
MSGSLNGRTGEMLRILIPLAVAIGASVIASRIETSRQIAVVETRLDERKDDITEIKQDVKEIQNETRQFRDEIRAIVNDAARGIDRRTGEPVLLQRSIEQGR